MGRLLTITFTSHRGRHYPVELFSRDTEFTETGAVYLYMRLPEGRAVQAQVLYVGAGASLAGCIARDRREGGLWDRAETMGFDTIGALALARPEDRGHIAAEFIQSWHPPLNDGHGALAGLMGLPAPLPELRRVPSRR